MKPILYLSLAVLALLLALLCAGVAGYELGKRDCPRIETTTNGH